MGLGGQAASGRFTGAVPPQNFGRARRNAPILDGAAVRARRRQRARSAPSSSRRGCQRARGSGWPRGGLRWLGRRWVAPSTLRPSLAAAKPPLPSLTGWRTSSCSSPTPASLQEIVRRRDKKERTGSKAPPRYWRDRERTLKKTTVLSETVSLNFLNMTATVPFKCSTK